MHSGLLPPRLVGRVAQSYVVHCDRTVPQHVPEMMHHLRPVPCAIPAARLREEGIRNQRTHQGPEPDEEVKSLHIEDRDV